MTESFSLLAGGARFYTLALFWMCPPCHTRFVGPRNRSVHVGPRHQILTSLMRIPKGGFTCVLEVLSKMGQLASTSDAGKRNHYSCPGYKSFDQRSPEIVTIAAEMFWRIRKEGSAFIDQRVGGVVGGRNGGAIPIKGICKQRLTQKIQSTRRWRSHAGSTGTNLQYGPVERKEKTTRGWRQ